MPANLHAPARSAFTLIELLVVISIIALLVGILLPALGSARDAARSVKSLAHIRGIGQAVAAYSSDHQGFFPKHSSPSAGPWPGYAGRPRWPDYLLPYNPTHEIYLSPTLTARELADFNKPFADTPDKKHGGYGLNFQYIGNARPNPTFHARLERDILAPSKTLVLGDTAGSRKGNMANPPGSSGNAVYVIDPPLGSVNLGSKGNGNTPNGSYYEGGSDQPNGTPATYTHRSYPAERNRGKANMAFGDGHGEALTLDQIDDSDSDGVKDNGLWNGRGDASQK